MIRSVLQSERIYFLVRIVLGLVFISSGGLKLMDPASFAEVVKAFAILPPELCYGFAILLPACEVIAGIGVIMEVRGSLFVLMIMLVGFVGVLSYAIYMGYDIDCGCFGPNDPEAKVFSSLKKALFRDLFFIALGLFLYSGQRSIDGRT